MTEKKTNENVKNIEDKDLDEVSGGALFSVFSDDEYASAGVGMSDPGVFSNDGYKLMASNEDLTESLANLAVYYYKAKGVPAKNISELRRWDSSKNKPNHG